MSGRQVKSASVKFTFSAGTPQKVKAFWGEPISWIKSVLKAEGIIVNKVTIHYHVGNVKNKCPLGEADSAEATFMLCTNPYDYDTFLHEIAHVVSPGIHSKAWAKKFIELAGKYLSGQDRVRALYTAHRDYPSCAALIGDIYDI